jgi:four helix bundle protein
VPLWLCSSIVIQELDETAYWLELLFDATIDRTMDMTSLMKETDELISIFTSIVKKVKNG